MIVFASLLFAQAAAALPAVPPTDPVDLEIVEYWMSAIVAEVGQTSEGGWRCSLSGTTTIAYLDDRLCQANTICALRHGSDREEIDKCLEDHREDTIADYRRAQRARGGLF